MARRRKPHLRPLQFEGLALRLGGDTRDSARAVAQARRILKDEGLDWRVAPFNPRARSLLIAPRAGAPLPTQARAWEISHRLRARRDVLDAEPAFVQPGEGPYRPKAGRRRAAAGAAHRPGTEDFDWALKQCDVFDAWNEPLPIGGAARGEGIVVAHPDTGWTGHPELANSTIDTARGFDFVAGDPDAQDPLDPPNAGHGTGTASVILSDANAPDQPRVQGVAPEATLVPLRVSNSVVHFSWARLTAALWRAIDRQTHVVSMSLGGPLPSFALHEAVEEAVDAGLILVAAAGNQWPFVVYPARYDEVIACAACNINGERWAGSASGSDVDITAPGESVWRAKATAGGFDIDRSSGTSYAAAHVAGIAALWLAYHGRGNLMMKYGAAGVAPVFKQLLTTAGVAGTPASWPDDVLGAGIVNAQSLLAAPLPPSVHAAGMRVRRGARKAAESDLERIASYFPTVDPDRVRAWLAETFGVSQRALPATLARLGGELAFHLTVNPATYATVHAQLAGRRGAIAPRTRLFRGASNTFKAALA